MSQTIPPHSSSLSPSSASPSFYEKFADPAFLQRLTGSLSTQTLEMMLHLFKLPVAQTPPPSERSYDLLGFMEFQQPHWKGVFVVFFEKPFMLALVNQLYQQKLTELDELALDGAREITSMIYSNVKTFLNREGASLQALTAATRVPGSLEAIESLQNSRGLATLLELAFSQEKGLLKIALFGLPTNPA